MRTTIATFAIATAVALAMFAMPAVASTFLAMDLKQLAAKSDAVVRGEVLSVRAFWDPDHTTILSEAVLRVDERLWGDVFGGEIAVRSVGGRVGDHQILADGFPKFEVGDEVVLFIRQRDDRSLQVTGFQLGHFDVLVRDGVEILVPTLDPTVTLVDAKGNNLPPPEPFALTELRDQLRAVRPPDSD